MSGYGYGQFCSIARAHEVLGGRWTLLVVREILCGSCRFNDIRRGIPRISRTMLSERLQALVSVGALERTDGDHGPEYVATPAGRELFDVIRAFGVWGQKWLPRHATEEDLDAEPLLIDMQRRVQFAALPKDPLVVRFEMQDQPRRFMLLKPSEASLCTHNPGFPEPLSIRGAVAALASWWRGDVEFLQARRAGLAIDGPKALTRAFPNWFDRYLFADVPTARPPMNRKPSVQSRAAGVTGG